jgi:hypothetical protein
MAWHGMRAAFCAAVPPPLASAICIPILRLAATSNSTVQQPVWQQQSRLGAAVQ